MITLNIPDDQLSTLVDALNNAILSLHSTYFSIKFGLESFKWALPLYDKDESELDKRLSILKEVYDDLLAQENKNLKN